MRVEQLSEQSAAFHRSVKKMKDISALIGHLRTGASDKAESAAVRRKEFHFTADQIGNLAEHSKTNVEAAISQLAIFAEMMRELERDLNMSIKRIEENLEALRTLETSLENNVTLKTKEDREKKDRM